MISHVNAVMKEFDPAVVQVTSYYAPIIALLAHLRSIPVVSDYHASMRVMERSLPLRLANAMVELKALNSADMTIVPTRILSSYILRRYGKGTVVVPNCIDLEEFKPTDSKRSVRRELGVGEEVKIIFFHGSPYPENFEALRRLGEIAEEMNNQGVPTLALVAGVLRGTANKSVRYLGYIEDLPAYISAADLAMLPVTISEMGIRSRVIEYLACGLPVVTTPSGATGMEEAVQGGIVAVGESNDELVEAAHGLLELDSAESQKLGKDARHFAEQNFSPTRAARQLEEVYSAVVERGRS